MDQRKQKEEGRDEAGGNSNRPEDVERDSCRPAETGRGRERLGEMLGIAASFLQLPLH